MRIYYAKQREIWWRSSTIQQIFNTRRRRQDNARCLEPRLTEPDPAPADPKLPHPTGICLQIIPPSIHVQYLWNHTDRPKLRVTENQRRVWEGETRGQIKTHKHSPQVHTDRYQENQNKTTKILLEKTTMLAHFIIQCILTRSHTEAHLYPNQLAAQANLTYLQ